MTHLKKRAIVLAATSAAVVCLIGGGAMRATAQGQSLPGTSISATVSAAASFTRTISYGWNLSQSVSPTSAQLTSTGTVRFTHTLKACRTPSGQTDSNFSVGGQVCVTNSGLAATDNLQIVVKVQDQVGGATYQDLPGAAQTITPATQIPARQTQCYSYGIIPFTPVPGATYRVLATVTVTNHSGSQTSGPSPKTAIFGLTTPTNIVKVDDTATVTDALQTLNCSGFTTLDSLASPSAWNIQSVDNKGCATKTFTVDVTNAGSTGTIGCPLMDTANLTGNTSNSQLAHADASVLLCYPTQGLYNLSSCLQDEQILQAYINLPSGQLNPDGQQASFLQDLLNRINQARASVSTKKNPVPPLTRIQVLDTAAQDYSQTLVTFAPTTLAHDVDGTTPSGRVMSAGYSPATAGENLARGQWSAQEVINDWMNSDEHRENMLNPNFTQVGLGLAGGATSSDTFVLYWVADFGSPSTGSYDSTPAASPSPVDVRAVAAQLRSYLQQADAALCVGNASAVDAALGPGGFVGYWNSQNLISYSHLLSSNVGGCLRDVLGFYATFSSANYTTTTSYITTNLIIPSG